MRPSTALTTLIACVLLLALPASAWANASDDRIINDCQSSPTGALRGSYTQQQLNHARHHLPGDVREYTGCSEAISQALLAGGGGGSDGGGGGGGTSGGGGAIGGGGGTSGGAGGAGGTAPLPQAQPPAGAEQPLHVAGAAVAPGALPEIGTNSHRLPPGLLALLALLGLLGLAALVPAALTIGRRVVGHRHPS